MLSFWKRGTTVLFQRFGLKNHFRGSEVFAGASVFQNSCSYASRLLSRSLICESCLCFSCKSSQNLTFMDKRRDKPHSKVDIDMNPRLSSSGNKGSGGGNVGKSRGRREATEGGSVKRGWWKDKNEEKEGENEKKEAINLVLWEGSEGY